MPNNSQFVAAQVPEQVAPGEQFPAAFSFLNTGDTAWSPEGANAYNLSSVEPVDNFTWGTNRLHLPPGSTVLPGATGEFSGTLTAPQIQGFVSCQWQVVQEFDEGVAQPPEVATVGGQMIGIDVGDDRDHGLQIQE